MAASIQDDQLAAYTAGIVTAAITASAATEKNKSKKFSDSLLEEYAILAGIGVVQQLDESILTPFYRGLQEHKKDKIGARKFIEKHLAPKESLDPEADVQMTTIFSTSVISAICNIDMIGQDTDIDWEERMHGAGLFNLAPVPKKLLGQARKGRHKCMQYERVTNQKHEDIQRADGATTSVEDWPRTPARVRAWVLTFYRHTKTMFGDKFILLPLLFKLLRDMQVEHNWLAADEAGCMTLTWAIHRGIRIALGNTKNLEYLQVVADSFKTGGVPSLAYVGSDIGDRIVAATTRPSNGKPNSNPPTMGGGAGSHQPTESKKQKFETFEYGNDVSGPEMAQAWALDIQAMKTAVGRRFRGREFCGYADTNQLFGADFRKLMPPDCPTPCMSYFVFGKCHDKCTRSHTTTATPTQEVLDGLKTRIKAQCKKTIAKNS